MPDLKASPRNWLIALNASDQITRSALCRLAMDLERWTGGALDEKRDLYASAMALGVPIEQLRKALALRPRIGELVARETGSAEACNGRIVTLDDSDYPAPLRELALPPPVLYVRGTLPDGPAIAMVGSRRLDAYGREVAECFARDLARRGITVVSGFAIGIDTVAHRAAVAENGKTVAVLGCGLDVDYPRGRGELIEQICRHGGLVSEFPFGAPPRPWHFPIRNRVIAALASSTLVVQATLRSGTLITAHHALELGRDVYAVPGRIFDERALGTNALLADGALVARAPEDLLVGLPNRQQELFPHPAAEVAGFRQPSTPVPGGLAGEILEQLPAGTSLSAEEISGALGPSVDRVLSALLELELAGWIRRHPGPAYSR